uniref:NBR1 autophagy cargo receptor b n=1 Tax=Amphilophus citrinellus TaxID=61819 RepID=A0A3Q0SRA1_AMPCI
MDFYINLKVNFRGNSKNFLLSGSETKSWESMEAMVKRSFGLCSLQLTYFDEENEESAARQGNRLHMNVYETRGQLAKVATTKASGTEPKRGFRPPQHCPSLAQVVSRKVQAAVPEQGMVIMKEVKGTKEEDKTPPAWFTSYMEKGGAEIQQVPEVSSSTLPGAPSSSTPPCSSCRGQTTGGGYQCVCTSCTLCEPCSFSHDPSHNLVRARTPLSIPEHGSPAPDHSFYRRGDRSFRKAEKQRLKAEKRLLKAEVKEIRKQLRMERRGIQWSSSHRDGSSSPVLLQPRATQHNSPRPKRPCPLVVPAMTAAFLDENLPDGTRLRPGTKFIKYWKMRNTGTLSWSADTKREQPLLSVDQEEYYIPSVDLLTAQDLLSFELLDINIVQELESVPNNTPAMTPCMSPLPQDGHLQDKGNPSLGLIQEETEVINPGAEGGGVPAQEEGEDDISGTQFVCETVIRSMTLEEILPKTPTDPDSPSAEHQGSTTGGREADEVDEAAAAPGMELSGTSSANDMLCTSQTLDDEPLTPEVVAPPKASVTSRQQGITGGLVKGALSVAASAYKALFTGQGPTQPPVDASTQDTMMAVLVEMGFADRSLNQRLLKKHNYNLLDVVNELVQMTDNDWYSTRY